MNSTVTGGAADQDSLLVCDQYPDNAPTTGPVTLEVAENCSAAGGEEEEGADDPDKKKRRGIRGSGGGGERRR